jgi:hypothetical protein
MIKSAFIAVLATAATLGAGSAHAGGVSWSIGINTPVVGSVISNAPYPYYGPVYAPAPVYESVPVYRDVPQAYYPGQVYYRPVPVAYPRYEPGWRHGDHRGRDHDRDRDHDHDRWNDRR